MGETAYDRSVDAVIVYAFDYFNSVQQRWLRGPVPATMAAINSNNWRVVEGSGHQVFSNSVASSGIAFRWASGQHRFAEPAPEPLLEPAAGPDLCGA